MKLSIRRLLPGAWFFLLRLLAFWLLFFAVFRLWFVAWFHAKWPSGETASVWAALWHAWPLDLSMAAYLMAVPALAWALGAAVGGKSAQALEQFILWFNVLVFSILVLVFGSNVFIYEEWNTLLNRRALDYLATPSALLDSMSLGFKFVSVGLYLGFVFLWWKVYGWLVGKRVLSLPHPSQERKPVSRWQALWLPVFMGLLFLAIRGGLGVMPINESAVYYSSDLFSNHAATNPAWHLLHTLVEKRATENHYRFMANEVAAPHALKLLYGDLEGAPEVSFAYFEKSDSTPVNVVFILLESMTAQVIEELGGEKGLCPNFSALTREGILFENMYGSGFRTDQGLMSVLAGYPAQPDQSVLFLEDKAVKLPSLPKILHEAGYQDLFLYGGELTFANLGTWLANQGFDRILSEKDFPRSDRTQRWGVDDNTMLYRFGLEINRLRQPFFAVTLTLSLHPPYDAPDPAVAAAVGDPDKFRRSATFVDVALGRFFSEARQQPWFSNTLFVLVADHGASPPSGAGLDNPVSRHIPLLLYSPMLEPAWRGRRIPFFGNHHDIPHTVLHMLNLRKEEEIGPGVARDRVFGWPGPWSRSLWWPELKGEKAGGFAYYTNENGLGWVTPKGAGFYRFENKDWQWFGPPLDSTSQTQAKAYLQMLYEDFLRL